MVNRAIVICGRPGYEHRADLLSAQLNFPLVGEDQLDSNAHGLALLVDESGLSLQLLGPKPPGPVRCDFAGGAAQHRRLYGGGKGQDIAKAVGLNKSGFTPSVLDVTAGLGQDAFVLATLGARVTLCERNPVVQALLADGIERAQVAGSAIAEVDGDRALQDVIGRMRLVRQDALNYLEQLEADNLPDVIYVDPMYPPRGKAAKVKKEMQVFHQLVGENQDAGELLSLALLKARYRAVVKRPAHAPALGEREPGYSLKGKSTRFDIYPLKKLPT